MRQLILALAGCLATHMAIADVAWFSAQRVYAGLQACEAVATERGDSGDAASEDQMRRARECLLTQGYVQGVADAIARNPAFALTICIPQRASALTLWNGVYEWMVVHSAELDTAAPVAIEEALEAAWPCAVEQR